jgi:hypothetical protein
VIAKPWGATPSPDGPTGGVDREASSVAAITPTIPTPSPTLSAEDQLREHCLAPSSWRTFSLQRWDDQTVRAWVAIEPVPAVGPTDPAIPFVAVIASGVLALGYCAPVVGPERPAAGATMAAWRLADDGATAERLAPQRTVPPVATILGGLFVLPAGGNAVGVASDGWPPGRYVFDVDGHWFGAEVRLIERAVKPVIEPPVDPAAEPAAEPAADPSPTPRPLQP